MKMTGTQKKSVKARRIVPGTRSTMAPAVEAVFSAYRAPIRKQTVEPNRVDNGSGQDMGTDFRPFFHHHDGNVGVDLLESDSAGQAGGSGTNNHDIEFHCFAGGQLGHEHLLSQLSTFAHGAAIAQRSC